MFRRFIARLLIVSVAGLGLTAPAQAALVATDAALAGADQERISGLLERVEVRAQLQAYGVDPAQVRARVAALTDAEAAQVAAQLDQLPAGGESVLGVLLVVFIVLLITDILGFTKIFPFTKPVR